MAELFGFKFERIKDEKGSEKFTPPTPDDGTLDVAGGGFFGQILDTDGRERTEQDLIRRYRDIAQQPECDSAIEDIINEGIVSDERDQSVSIILEQLPYPKKIKDSIRKEFDNILSLLDFDVKGHDIFRRWYVDGRLFYHKVINKKSPRKGIQELRYIEPRKIRKVRELQKDVKSGSSIELIKGVQEYYIYNEKGLQIAGGTQEGIKIAPDSISYCPSGLIDQNKGHVLSYLHKAIKPVNQLRMIEDAVVIYRISRAPERRIFYIDVGNLGGSNLGEIDDIKYFQNKLYRALNVPVSRMEAENNFSLGRSTEITRDELKFTKFVQRLRKKFTPLFTDLLKTQLILKGIVTLEEWPQIKEHIQYDFLQDGHFAELKKAEILKEQLDTLQTVESYIGTFFSKKWVQNNVLNMTDNEVEDMQKQINKEAGLDPDEGGVEVPTDTDGVTRYPSVDGAPIPADDLAKYQGEDPPDDKGEK
jgi:hypothetical protein